MDISISNFFVLSFKGNYAIIQFLFTCTTGDTQIGIAWVKKIVCGNLDSSFLRNT